jgi:hypothetical protein
VSHSLQGIRKEAEAMGFKHSNSETQIFIGRSGEPQIRGDAIARLQQDDIIEYEFRGIDFPLNHLAARLRAAATVRVVSHPSSPNAVNGRIGCPRRGDIDFKS